MSEWPIDIENEITQTQAIQLHFISRGEFIRCRSKQNCYLNINCCVWSQSASHRLLQLYIDQVQHSSEAAANDKSLI